MRHPGRGGHGGQDAVLGSEERPDRCAGVPAHQPPARLPDMRPGWGVRASGLHLPGRAPGHPVQSRLRQALQPGRRFRSRCAVRPEPVHPVHALRPVHGRRGEGAGTERLRAGRPRLHRDPPRGAARPPLGGQRRGPLPGRLAPVEGLPAQGTGLGARQIRVDLHRLFPGVQHHAGHARGGGRAGPAQAEPRGEPLFHLRPRSHELPLDEPGRPHRGPPREARRGAARDRLG